MEMARKTIQFMTRPAIVVAGFAAALLACHPPKRVKVSAPEKIYSGGRVWALAVDDQNIYWHDEDEPSILKGPRKGLAASNTSRLATAGSVNEIVVDSANVYWLEPGDFDENGVIPNTGQVMMAPLAGGAATTLATKEDDPFVLAVDAANLYWADFTGKVSKLPLTGGQPTKLGQGGRVRGLAVDANFVYWSDTPSRTAGEAFLMKTPIDGGASVTMHSGLTSPGHIRVDGSEIYWADYGTYQPVSAGRLIQFNGMIARQGASEANYSSIADHQQLPDGLAVANGNIYWSNGQIESDGQVYAGSIAMFGPRGVQTVADNQDRTGLIVARGSDVYWGVAGGIMHVTVTVE